MLNPEDTVFDTVDRVAVGDIRLKIRDMLGAFMFSGEDIDKKVGVLSGGERTRLAMIKLLLEPVNLLILDEPTNHLDIRSKEILKQAIKDFGGTAIIVSHDREFLDGLVSKTYEFRGGKMKLHLGGIYDFLRDRKLESLRELEAEKAKAAAAQVKSQPKVAAPVQQPKEEAPKPAKPQMTYEQKREYDRKVNKLTKGVKSAEDDIAKAEAEIADIEKQLANCSGNEQATELAAKHTEANAKLERLMTQWEDLQAQLEELTK